ncbi:hypothetical protein IFM89_007069 [Coptis chinensis]|uniref:Uncharacterized protein n=1 Tax=Coptis chinensis TaxID=261450 RepID=A0A835I6C1_9MAGN|nr:hypothetical protein IFM89_007069 [Coptis chinensis]
MVNSSLLQQPRAVNVIEVDEEALQNNRANTEDTYGEVHTSKNAQEPHLGDGNATDKEQLRSAEVSGQGLAETIRAPMLSPLQLWLFFKLLAPEAVPSSALVVFQAARENEYSVYDSSDSMNQDRVAADLASSLPITPNRFRAL